MYIEPNTIIRILKDCPLDTTYDHTIYFNSASAQANYFAELAKYTLNNQTYQRVNRNRMRVQYKADDLYDCNYIMFQNSAYGNKWFYAFIRSVEFVNNITSEIEYEIDVMQTWFFDYSLGQCFIDREHSSTDTAGDNLVPENLELGDYVADDFDGTGELGAKSIVVAATFNGEYNNIGGSIYSGIYSGLFYNVFPNSDSGAQACTEFIQGAGAKADGIVAVFLMPTAMVTDLLETAKEYTINKDKKVSLIRADGSVVKNKKLLTYPYNFLYVTNLQGNYAEYHYELFSTSDCQFTLTGDMSTNPSVVLAPNSYKGVSGIANYDEKLVLSGFPQLSFNTDSFKAWLAQNGSSLAINALSASAGLVGATASAAMAGSSVAGNAPVANAALGAANLVSQVYQHSVMPHQAKGGSGSQTLAAIGVLDFAFMHKHIQPQFASIIDDYFTMYGYATHRVKVPNRNVRPHWTYTKTVGCVIEGSVPCDDVRRICNIYNNGITFWKNGNEIGNYNLNNSV